MKKYLIFIAIALALCFVSSPDDVFAATVPGDLIKLVSDNNPDTQHDAAVYYVADDGKRYVFPSSKVYHTWYEDFSGVREVSEAEMAAHMIGGNITYRPGTRLIKITSDPTVYAVEPGGVLRAIGSESIANDLYGESWNQIIDDVPDTYFINYSIGSPLAAPVWPTGTVVRRSSDDAFFYIDNGTKRRISTEDLLDQLRIQEQHLVTTELDLSTYPEAESITAPEAAITDTAERNVVSVAVPPQLRVQTPPSTFIAVASNATLLELHITAGRDVRLTRLTAVLQATTDDSRDEGEVDDDAGGLVYGNNAQKNFSHLTFVNGSGFEVLGRQEIALDVNLDQVQTLNYTGNLLIPAGEDVVLFLKARLNHLLPDSEGYQVKLLNSGIQFIDDQGQLTPFLPASDIIGPALTTLADSLEVDATAAYSNQTYVKGALNVPITDFTLHATTSAPNVVQSMTMQGYIDEGDSGGFLPGSDADNGTETLVRETFVSDQVTLRNPDGSTIAGPETIDVNGVVTFTGMNLYIPAGGSQQVIVHGDISHSLNLEGSPNMVAFDIEDAALNVIVTDETGDQVPASGKNPNHGVNAIGRLTIREKGEMDLGWYGDSGNQIAGQEVHLGDIKFEPQFDDYLLKIITFRQSSSTADSLGNLRLEYDNQAGEVVSVDGEMLGGLATFSGLAAWLPRDTETSVRLYGDIYPKIGGVVYGEELGVDLNIMGPLVFSSVSTLDDFEATDLNLPGFELKENRSSAIIVRYSKLYASKSEYSPSGDVYRGSEIQVLRFSLAADETGMVRVRKLSFMLDPSDAGKEGSDNDALELWADRNGDARDDDGVVNLKRVYPNGTKDTFGEDSSVSIRYYIASGSSRDSTPSGYDSQSSDYGIIEYDIDEGSEIIIPAGASFDYQLELYTTAFAQDRDYSLKVELMTNGDFLWTDIPSGTYEPLPGTAADGVVNVKSSLNVKGS